MIYGWSAAKRRAINPIDEAAVISPVQTSQSSPATDLRNTPSPAAPASNLAPPTTISTGAATSTEAGQGATPVGRANPTFQFDPAAGVVVVQFRNDSGKVDLSIPSQQQLNAYATDRVEGQQPGSNTVFA